MAQDIILDSDSVSEAFTKANGDITETFTKNTAQDLALAAAAAGSGVVVSATDTTQGFIANKITSTDGSITMTTGSPAGDETRDFSIETYLKSKFLL